MAGTYNVTITPANSCPPIQHSVTINEPSSAISLSMTSTDETSTGASDGTATAYPSGGTAPYTYLWSTAATTQTITGLSPAQYDVTVTDANGCIRTGSVTVNPGTCLC